MTITRRRMPSNGSRFARIQVRVTCGRRRGKNFLTFLQHWSGAVTCPAC
jgi:hypothetical protein